jgi:hypothetical protein
MSAVILALYAEGSTDRDFLPQIILRTTKNILLQHGSLSANIDVMLPFSEYKKPKQGREECIVHMARETAGYHALIIHSDGETWI